MKKSRIQRTWCTPQTMFMWPACVVQHFVQLTCGPLKFLHDSVLYALSQRKLRVWGVLSDLRGFLEFWMSHSHLLAHSFHTAYGTFSCTTWTDSRFCLLYMGPMLDLHALTNNILERTCHRTRYNRMGACCTVDAQPAPECSRCKCIALSCVTPKYVSLVAVVLDRLHRCFEGIWKLNLLWYWIQNTLSY